MKRFLLHTVLVFAAIFSTASMCEDDEDNNDQDNNAIETSLGRGSWKVTYFFDKSDGTGDFDGYSFLFNDNNVAIATKNALSVQGSWDTEHSSDGNTKLYLDFGTTGPLDELNADWLVIESTPIGISLEHESGGNGDTATLTFEKK